MLSQLLYFTYNANVKLTVLPSRVGDTKYAFMFSKYLIPPKQALT